MKIISKKDILLAQMRAYKSPLHGERNYLIISTFAKTGVRVSELINITPASIFIDERQIVIRGKGNKIRHVDVAMDIILQLTGYAKRKKIDKNKSIFKITRQQIGNITREIADTNPHAFRHAYTIELLRKTKNIRYVQKQLGHSGISTTQIYLQFMEFSKDKEKIDQLWL